MHALLLALALGQVAPDRPRPAATPVTSPATAPATTTAAPPATPPRRPVGGQPLRPVEFSRLPDGSFRAALDGEPVAGAAFYRAVLRPDLAERSERARNHRLALFIASGVAPVAGLGAGWVWATAQHRPVPDCIQAVPIAIGGSGVSACEQVEARNGATMTRGLVAGGLAGLAAGAVLAAAGTSMRPFEPTAGEAEALVRAYRARAAPEPTPAPVPGGPAGSGRSLELEAGPGAARLVLRFGF